MGVFLCLFHILKFVPPLKLTLLPPPEKSSLGCYHFFRQCKEGVKYPYLDSGIITERM